MAKLTDMDWEIIRRRDSKGSIWRFAGFFGVSPDYIDPTQEYLRARPDAAARAVMLAFVLLVFGNEAQANCDQNGIITGPNAAIVLGSGGCADAPGNTSAIVVNGATVTSAGTGIASVASPGWAVTNQGTITATGNAVTGDVSFTLTNSGTITAGLSGALVGGGCDCSQLDRQYDHCRLRRAFYQRERRFHLRRAFHRR